MVDVKKFDDDPHELLRTLFHLWSHKAHRLDELSQTSAMWIPKTSALWYPGSWYRLTIFDNEGTPTIFTSKGNSTRQAAFESPAPDMVNQPPHYNQGDVECIDAMVSAFGMERVATFCHINAFKYLFRSFDKENAERDREKAIWFLRFANGDDPRRDNDDDEQTAQDSCAGLCNPCPTPITDGLDFGVSDDEFYHVSPRRGSSSIHDDEC